MIGVETGGTSGSTLQQRQVIIVVIVSIRIVLIHLDLFIHSGNISFDLLFAVFYVSQFIGVLLVSMDAAEKRIADRNKNTK